MTASNIDGHEMPATSLGLLLKSDKETHGAIFTVLSLKSGKDYTFQINRSEFKGRLYTHCMVDTGYLEFIRLGTYKEGHLTNRQMPCTSEAAVALAWLLRKVEEQKFDLLANTVKIFHLGRCLKCGRVLTDAESIQIGLGPVCRGF